MNEEEEKAFWLAKGLKRVGQTVGNHVLKQPPIINVYECMHCTWRTVYPEEHSCAFAYHVEEAIAGCI